MCWVTTDIRRALSFSERSSRCFPSRTMSPLSLFMVRYMVFRRVDFPEPFGPRRPTNSPSSTWRLAESTILFLGLDTEMSTLSTFMSISQSLLRIRRIS